MTAPLATVARDGAVWRWECRYCLREDTRWRHADAFREACEHLARHQTFGFRSDQSRETR